MTECRAYSASGRRRPLAFEHAQLAHRERVDFERLKARPLDRDAADGEPADGQSADRERADGDRTKGGRTDRRRDHGAGGNGFRTVDKLTRHRRPPSASQRGGSEVRIIFAASPKCGILKPSHTRSISCECPSIPKFASERAAR